MNNYEKQFYDTAFLINAFSDEDQLIKNASIMNEIVSKIKNYVSSHIDPNNPTRSVVSILTPGVIFTMLKSLGFGKIGTLFVLATQLFGVDIGKILYDITSELKNNILNNKKYSSSEIDGLISSKLSPYDSDTIVTSSDIRLANLIKTGINNNYAKTVIASRKKTTIGIIGKILSWLFKVILASTGFMVAGDAINKLVGRPNAFDGTLQEGKPVSKIEKEPRKVVSTQTKFPQKSTYTETIRNNKKINWVEQVPNNESSIENLLIDFTNDVYDGLSDATQIIKNTPTFQHVLKEIVWYNKNSSGGPVVFIPKMFESKKHLVDHFINDVAKRVETKLVA